MRQVTAAFAPEPLPNPPDLGHPDRGRVTSPNEARSLPPRPSGRSPLADAATGRRWQGNEGCRARRCEARGDRHLANPAEGGAPASGQAGPTNWREHPAASQLGYGDDRGVDPHDLCPGRDRCRVWPPRCPLRARNRASCVRVTSTRVPEYEEPPETPVWPAGEPPRSPRSNPCDCGNIPGLLPAKERLNRGFRDPQIVRE